eukprot:TRINITY_DN12406_c0_g2_i1.p1 TRINITY_DN12406_c0_g2~~TRINITY_DN12406_c0_g2_i1.p1  ORF type:complete len:730 (+),score=100.90 TRINITY_DN12406_c0_g2_i1:1538-3727(+)
MDLQGSTSLDSLRLFTRVPWQENQSALDSTKRIQTSSVRSIGSSVEASRSLPELRRAKSAGASVTPSKSNNLQPSRPKSFVLHTSSRYRLNLEKPAANALLDSEDEVDQSDEALASSANLRLRASETPSIIVLYRDACDAHGSVPVAALEASLQKEGVIALTSHGINYKGVRALADTLSDCDAFNRIALIDNGICEKGAQALASLCDENAYITELDLSSNRIGTSGIDAIAAAIKNGCHLRSLALDDNAFLCMDLTEICESLKNNHTLKTLRLARNRIGDVGCSHIARMLIENRGILELDLSDNRIRTKGAALIADSLAIHEALQALYLSFNACGDAGAAAIAKALEGNDFLKQLRLDHNSIGDRGAEALASVLSRCSLEYLALAHNPLSNAAVSKLLDVLEAGNTSIRVLDLEGIALSKENRAKLEALTQMGFSFGTCTESFDVPGGMDTAALRAAAKAAKERMGAKRQSVSKLRRMSRRRSSMMFVRRPSKPFDPSWSPEEAWANGYNPDGTIRMDPDWLEHRDEYDPSWTAAEAWARGYHPDGKKRDLDRAATRRLSRLSFMGVPESFDSGNIFDQYNDFEEEAVRTFSLLYPNTDDPMEIIEAYVAHHKLRLVDFFKQMDKDSNGIITANEIDMACEELDIPLNQIQMDELMFRLDLDGDGVIDYHEFCEGRRMLKEKHTGFRFRHPDDTPSESEDETRQTSALRRRQRSKRKTDSGSASEDEDD